MGLELLDGIERQAALAGLVEQNAGQWVLAALFRRGGQAKQLVGRHVSQRHHVALEARRIAAFLLLDPDFPRSVRHNLAALQATLESIERLNPGAPGTAIFI